MKLLLILGMVAALTGPVEVTSPSGDLKVSLENPVLILNKMSLLNLIRKV